MIRALLLSIGVTTSLWAQLQISEICPEPLGLDPNGRKSGWVELENRGEAPVNLADYKLMRFNRGKALNPDKFSFLQPRIVEPGGMTVVYTSERYDNAEALGGDGMTVKNYGNGVMVLPATVNPKNFPYVVLMDREGRYSDPFIVPVDLPKGRSFSSGRGSFPFPLITRETPYRYRSIGEKVWREGGRGRIAAYSGQIPSDVEGWLACTPVPDLDFPRGRIIDKRGLALNGAYDLSGNSGENTGLTLPLEVTSRLTGEYSLSLRFRVSGLDGGERPLMDSRPSHTPNRSGIIVYMTAEGQISVQPRDNRGAQTFTTDSPAPFNDDCWHHLLLVSGQRAGESVRLWIDGVEHLNSRLTVDPLLQPSYPICIGRSINSRYWSVFRGYLADIRVMPRALSEEEAVSLPHENPEGREMTEDVLSNGKRITVSEGVYTFSGPGGVTEGYLSHPALVEEVGCGETLDLWVNPSSFARLPQKGAVVLVDARSSSDRGPGYMILFNEDGTLWLQRGPGGGMKGCDNLQFEEKLPLNRWSHLTFTLDRVGRHVRLYLNGCPSGGEKTMAYAYTPPTVDRRFGGSRDGFWSPFSGSLLAPRLFSGLLAGREIAKLHNSHPYAEEAGGKVVFTDLAGDVDTPLLRPTPFSGLEVEYGFDLEEAWTNDSYAIRVEGRGAVTLTLDGRPVWPDQPFPIGGAPGHHRLVCQARPQEDGSCGLMLSLLRDHPVDGVTRAILPNPTPGQENDLTGAVGYGPNAGPLYGVKHSLSDLDPVPPALPGQPYWVQCALNPLSASPDNAVSSLTLLYRAQFGEIKSLPMTFSYESSGAGRIWEGCIPPEDLPPRGGLIQWAFRVEEQSGALWRTPSFRNPDDGYGWYGTLVEPLPSQQSETLQTLHLFADSQALSLMDRQIGDIEGKYPYGARIAIYDAQSQRYFDNVRIDLRGNSSAGFNKKSHGLRFNSCQPFSGYNAFTGEKIDDVRKTSFLSEFCDPTLMRQALSFWFWRQAGNLVPFSYPVRLQMNGEFYQLAFHSNRFTDELIEDYYGLKSPDGSIGYSYKSVGTLSPNLFTTGGGIEKKTPGRTPESDLSVLRNFTGKLGAAGEGRELENPDLTRVVVESFNLPAWINYLASARLTQECDDVWANMCIYYDSVKTDTWMPLGYDQNVSFGQYFNGGAVAKSGTLATRDDHKGHPFYGGLRVRSGNRGNYGIEAVLQSPKFRRLFLRRLRTLMDEILKAPGTPRQATPFWLYLEGMKAALAREVELDHNRWDYGRKAVKTQIYVWKEAMGLEEGVNDLWENYVEPRRRHLFNTHSVSNTAKIVGYGQAFNAGIPASQAPTADLAPGIAFLNAANTDGTLPGFSDPVKLVVTNGNPVAVDMSGWRIAGAVNWTLPPGAVVDAKDVLTVVFDRKGYIAAHRGQLADSVILGNAERGRATTLTLTDPLGVEVERVDWTPVRPVHDALRVAEVLANTLDGGGDGAEYLILTNCSDHLSIPLSGVRIRAKKSADTWARTRVDILLPSVVLSPGGSYRAERGAFLGAGWNYLTDNKVDLELYDAEGVLCQSLYFESSWWPSTDGGGASLIARTFGARLSWREEWRPSFEYPEDPAGRESVQAALLADQKEMVAWFRHLSEGEEGRRSLRLFPGTEADLYLCRLVDIPPQAGPEVTLRISRFSVYPLTDAALEGKLFVNGVEKRGGVNGSLFLQKFGHLDAQPIEEEVGERSFPVTIRVSPGSYRFFRLLVRGKNE